MRYTLFVKAALEALLTNGMRSFLTMLGIIIGVAAIVIIIAVGDGAQSLILNQISSFGSDLIGVLPGSSDEDGPPATALGVTITSFTNDDVTAIRRQVRGVTAITGYVNGAGSIAWGNQSVDAQFSGVSAEYPTVESAELALGTFFTSDDDDTLANVAVLGWQVYQDLFGDMNPLGQNIKIKRHTFRVIGVISERGTVAFQNQDNQVLVPLQTAQKRLLGIDHVSVSRMKAAPGSDLTLLSEEVRELLRERHDIGQGEEDDFTVRNIAQALDILGTVTDVLKYFLAAISALSLLVGGIGIMNIMLVTVLERTKELGLRKAVGARPLDMRIQFLSETVIIAMLGGLIGLLVGVSISYLIAVVARSLGYYWEFIIGLSSVGLSIVFPLVIGLVFGFYPAHKAARLRPIDALHYE